MKNSPPEFGSPNAESHKLWLAQVGAECLQETADPARLLDRAHQAWQQQGHSEEWITQRMTGQESGNNPATHMSEPELIFAALAELSRQIAESEQATDVADNKASAEKGSGIAAQARRQLERQTGKSVVADINHLLPVVKIKVRSLKAKTLKLTIDGQRG
ncbi:hypothetical protein [Rhodoferax sp.]|uniref:hypothetical protein n=1 Tax=Rhodoferax sp. TaxID=50421 RepID=UPI0027307DEE|nr:hypothetical protein [Rhodoferax sp.]MDP2442514.1 hypothetical protein [Rhodoferax sp.]MDZ4207728.1 hypothetical protein [Rhodoferax sp.]